MEEVKELVQEAYRFGYFVGYRGGHSEWAEWVRRRREELYAKAEKLGVYELVKEAYNRGGKEEGGRKRTEEINRGLQKGLEKGAEEEVKAKVDQRPQPATTEGEEEIRETEEVEFARFLETTRLLLPPDLLDTLKHLKPPPRCFNSAADFLPSEHLKYPAGYPFSGGITMKRFLKEAEVFDSSNVLHHIAEISQFHRIQGSKELPEAVRFIGEELRLWGGSTPAFTRSSTTERDGS